MSPLTRKWDHAAKVVIAGDGDVGQASIHNELNGSDTKYILYRKSNILRRVTKQIFSPTLGPTAVHEIESVMIKIPGEDKVVKLHCWDLPGVEPSPALVPLQYRDATGALIVYDVTWRTSFENTRTWLAIIREHADPNITCILVANKLDLCSDEERRNGGKLSGVSSGRRKREVSQTEAIEFAQEEGLLYIEVSAKTGKNIDKAFGNITLGILQKINQGVFDGHEPPGSRDSSSTIYSKMATWFRDPRNLGLPHYLPNSLRETYNQELIVNSDPRPPTPEVIRISRLMSVSEIVVQLGNHGCANITNNLNLSKCTSIPVARGGYGDVYCGVLKDGTSVAIKTRRFQVNTSEEGQKALKRAAKEIHTWSKCQHPNVLPLLGFAKFRDQIGMVSPWLDNGDLPTYLSQHRNVDRCEMSTKVAEGLAYLHNHNIVHGDLKGCNVLVSREGAPMLADFGNAVLDRPTLQFTGTTTQPGFSARWTAPELLEGPCVPTAESDIYALGMTILEAITGQVPYPNMSDTAVILRVATRKHPKRPETHMPSDSQHGNPLWYMLRKCWAYETKARPNATEVSQFVSYLTRKGAEL